MSERSALTTVEMFRGVAQIPAGMSAGSAAGSATEAVRRRYSAATAAQIVDAVRALERIEDVITISAIARRTGISRPTVRAVLREECGWTPAESRRAHEAGVRRGKLLQAVAGHPGLAQGRATLQRQGWPNLERAQQTLRTCAYPALARGRQTQAAQDWPGLRAARDALSTQGYPHLEQGRANLAARGWPNAQAAHDALKTQRYLPLVEAQRLRRSGLRTQQNDAPMDAQAEPRADRRRARGRTTRLAILEALRACAEACADQIDPQDQRIPHAPLSAQVGLRERLQEQHVSCRELAARLHLHPSTVYAHLKQIELFSTQDIRA